MSDTSKTPAGASSQDLLVRGREITYRVARVILRTGSGIAAGFAIQARRQRAKTWLPCVIDGTPLRYWNAETAHKHCAWLNDPSGTEPEWGRDESPNSELNDSKSQYPVANTPPKAEESQ